MAKTKGKSKGRRPTIMQERLADEVIKNAGRKKPWDKAQIAREAGYSSDLVNTNSNRLFTAEGFRKALAERGITEQAISQKMNEGLDATQGAWFQGEWKESDAPDLTERRQYMSLLADMLGMKKLQVEQRTVQLTVEGDKANELLGLD